MGAQLKDLVIEEHSLGDIVIYDIPENGMEIGRANKAPEKPRFPHPDYRDDKDINELAHLVSRTHCELYFAGEKLAVRDTSRHGTYINNVKVPENKACILRDGDILGLGPQEKQYRFQVLIGDKPDELRIVD